MAISGRIPSNGQLTVLERRFHAAIHVHPLRLAERNLEIGNKSGIIFILHPESNKHFFILIGLNLRDGLHDRCLIFNHAIPKFQGG